MVKEGLVTVDDVQIVRYTHRFLNPLPVERFVSEVMTHEVITLSPGISIADAWRKMLDTLIKAMPVVDDDGLVLGMLTDDDLLERAGVQERLSVAEQLDAKTLEVELSELRKSSLKVGDVMTRPAITVRAHDALGVAARSMAKNGIKRLPVVDETGKLVGVLSRVDVLQLVTGKEARKISAPKGAAKILQDVMSPHFPVVRYNEGLAAIVDKIIECGCHRVIVVDFHGKAVGLISDSDVVARIQPEQRRGVLAALFGHAKVPASDVTAEKLMSPGVLTAGPETILVEAAQTMMLSKRKWLVVVDETGCPIGLVDRHILLRAMIGH
jgi:CBS domain-containing protein